ncbi:YcnI family protein [Paenibacillus thermoaerophilus]|nr:YcnI family protein [Paenibacillus thermoaerophilus]
MESGCSVKKAFALLLALVLVFALPAAAFAHVTVQPAEVTAGSYQVFTVRVPSEKESATVKVEVKIPEGVTISRFEPKPDWKYELQKDSSGKIVSVVWTATGQGLGATEFGEFRMNGKVDAEAKELVWKAYQTYQDGSVVEWVGADGSKTPASVTTVKPAPAGAGTDSHGHVNESSGDAHGHEDSGNDTLPLTLSIAALALSAVSLLMALRRKK